MNQEVISRSNKNSKYFDFLNSEEAKISSRSKNLRDLKKLEIKIYKYLDSYDAKINLRSRNL